MSKCKFTQQGFNKNFSKNFGKKSDNKKGQMQGHSTPIHTLIPIFKYPNLTQSKISTYTLPSLNHIQSPFESLTSLLNPS